MRNSSLSAAKTAQFNDFYTDMDEIKKELPLYAAQFQDKVIYCNCDDPFESNFAKYFRENFQKLELKELIVSGFRVHPSGGTDSQIAMRITKDSAEVIPLCGNYVQGENGEKTYFPAGDFRSKMCTELLQQSDILVSNPPFSLFKEYIEQIRLYNKQFLVLGSMNAITYKSFFPLLQNNQVWLGYSSGTKTYLVPDSYVKLFPSRVFHTADGWKTKLGNTVWYTNLENKKRHNAAPLNLDCSYFAHPEKYPVYVNFDAINVDRVSQIPCDYMGVMGVPISFLQIHCPEQFEILGLSLFLATPIREVAEPDDQYEKGGNRLYLRTGPHTLKRMYERLLVRRLSH